MRAAPALFHHACVCVCHSVTAVCPLTLTPTPQTPPSVYTMCDPCRSCRTRLQLRRKPKRSGSGSQGAGPWRELAGTARKAKRSRRGVSHSQHSSSQQRRGRGGEAQHWDEPQVAPTQCAGSKQEAPGCDAGGFGCTADSCQGDSAGGVAAAAAGTHEVAAGFPPKTASQSPDAAPSIARTSTAASANAVSALLVELGQNGEPHTGGAPEALQSPTALHMASLQQKCEVIQRQLQQQTFSMRAASTSRGVAAILQPPALAAEVGPPVLQGLPAWDSPTSPESAATAITAAGHMEMVEMVVARLDDSEASAEAAELEAMLEHELRAAASLPPEDAQNTWACQINQVINSWSSAISAAALPSLRAAVPAGSLKAPATGLPPQQQLGGYGLGLSAATGGPTPGGDMLPFDLRLMSLQHQLTELQGMVHNLRTEFLA